MTQQTPALSSIEEIIDDARAGRMCILVDDEDRENEGDLVIPAQMATPETVNFMARYGRGLICLALTQQRVQKLELPLMARHNASRHHTAFTVSIEAREGVSTGISAQDRATTIAAAIDPNKGKEGIVSPGHIFPLVAREGGVLVRAGHTEAAVDIARMAGLDASGVICEIMNDDGSMARMAQLQAFAQTHGLKIATIADLIAYRRRFEKLVRRVEETTFDSRYGGTFQMVRYTHAIHQAEHIALVKGDLGGEEPVLVRMHALDVLRDVLGAEQNDGSEALHIAMQRVAECGRGVVVVLHSCLEATDAPAPPESAPAEPAKKEPQLRDYGTGAQILRDLGVRNMRLLSNTPRPVVGLEGYDLHIAGYEPIG